MVKPKPINQIAFQETLIAKCLSPADASHSFILRFFRLISFLLIKWKTSNSVESCLSEVYVLLLFQEIRWFWKSWTSWISNKPTKVLEALDLSVRQPITYLFYFSFCKWNFLSKPPLCRDLKFKMKGANLNWIRSLKTEKKIIQNWLVFTHFAKCARKILSLNAYCQK